MATALVQVVKPLVLAGPPGQPDIAYTPNHDKYLARTQRRFATEQLNTNLPDGFPTKLESKLVWDGNTIAEQYEWDYVLTAADVDEIEAALRHFKCEVAPSDTAVSLLTSFQLLVGHWERSRKKHFHYQTFTRHSAPSRMKSTTATASKSFVGCP